MSEKQKKVVSFIGGLVFFSVVVGVLLVKNERIRAEVEEQATSLLKTTKSAVSQIQFVIAKIEKISGGNNSAQPNSNNATQRGSQKPEQYDELWSSIE